MTSPEQYRKYSPLTIKNLFLHFLGSFPLQNSVLDKHILHMYGVRLGYLHPIFYELTLTMRNTSNLAERTGLREYGLFRITCLMTRAQNTVVYGKPDADTICLTTKCQTFQYLLKLAMSKAS